MSNRIKQTVEQATRLVVDVETFVPTEKPGVHATSCFEVSPGDVIHFVSAATGDKIRVMIRGIREVR